MYHTAKMWFIVRNEKKKKYFMKSLKQAEKLYTGPALKTKFIYNKTT